MIPSKPNIRLLSNGGVEVPGSSVIVLQLGVAERPITMLLAVRVASGVFAAPVEHIHRKSYVSKKTRRLRPSASAYNCCRRKCVVASAHCKTRSDNLLEWEKYK